MFTPEQLDLQMIATAMTFDEGWELSWYLDTVTGQLCTHGMSDADDDLTEEQLEDPRYVPIEHMPSHESYRIMEDYVRTLPAGPLRTQLVDALLGRKPFRHFRNTLHEHDASDAWYAYQDAAMERYVIDWLSSLNLLAPAPPADPADPSGNEGSSEERPEKPHDLVHHLPQEDWKPLSGPAHRVRIEAGLEGERHESGNDCGHRRGLGSRHTDQ